MKKTIIARTDIWAINNEIKNYINKLKENTNLKSLPYIEIDDNIDALKADENNLCDVNININWRSGCEESIEDAIEYTKYINKMIMIAEELKKYNLKCNYTISEKTKNRESEFNSIISDIK